MTMVTVQLVVLIGWYPGHTLRDGEVVRICLATDDNGNQFILLF